MLPYFEEQNTYDQYDFTVNWDSPTPSQKAIPNAQLVAKQLPVFQCPSTPGEQRLDGDSQWFSQPYADWPSSQCAAPTDYSPICSVLQNLVNVTPPIVNKPADLTGLMVRNTVCTLKNVTDGTSHTIMLAESAGRPYVYQRGGTKIGDLPNHRVNGGGWSRAASDFDLYGTTTDGATPYGICAVNCTNGVDVFTLTGGNPGNKSTFPYPAPFGSNGTGQTYAFHPGGAYRDGRRLGAISWPRTSTFAFSRDWWRKGNEAIGDEDILAAN